MSEIDFLKYNIRNILGDLYAAEVHMRYVTPQTKDHMGCVGKHLLHARNELGEAISHSKDEQKRAIFQEGLFKVEKLLDKFEEGTIKLEDIREVRKFLEKHIPPYSTEDCLLCSTLVQRLDFNNSKTNNNNMMETSVKLQEETLPSISQVFDPISQLISDKIGIEAKDLSTYVALPTLSSIVYQGLGIVLTPFGKKFVALLGALGNLALVSFGIVRGRAKEDALVLTAVSIANVFDPWAEHEILEGLEKLKQGNIMEAFIRTDALTTLIHGLESLLGSREEREVEVKRAVEIEGVSAGEFEEEVAEKGEEEIAEKGEELKEMEVGEFKESEEREEELIEANV